MHRLKHLFLILCFPIFAQSDITASFISKIDVGFEKFSGVDNFGASYFMEDNTLLIINKENQFTYNNVLLGELATVNIFNPLKLNLFYRDLNTAIILDNRQAEIATINFNSIQPFRNVSHISTGNDNTIWLFNQDTQQLEIFNFKSLKSRVKTLPIEGALLDLSSNFNVCWALTNKYLYTYNYMGSLLSKTVNQGYSSLQKMNNTMLLLKDNTLFLKSDSKDNLRQIDLPELLIKQFFVTNETLYIYDGNSLYKYQLKND